MKLLLSGAHVFTDGSFVRRDFEFSSPENNFPNTFLTGFSDLYIFPGFTDMHVHFREPGFSYKETIKTGSAAAAHGGYTTVCTMPNLSPVPDCTENLEAQLSVIHRDACIDVLPFASITVGESGERLSDIEGLASLVCGYSDDGRGVRDAGLMREAMLRAHALGKLISAHCEDYTAPKDSPESEWKEIERDIKLADETKCALHVCHISTAESVRLIRDAKKSFVDITAETAPHYLLLTSSDRDGTGRFIMNPPLRTRADMLTLIEGINDGTIDAIATDHAPHSAEEKSRGNKSFNGITGLETSFPALYTGLVLPGIVPFERLISMFSYKPTERIGLTTETHPSDNFSVWSLGDSYKINPSDFFSLGKSTPFEGMTVYGRNLLTVCGGKIVYIAK